MVIAFVYWTGDNTFFMIEIKEAIKTQFERSGNLRL